MNQQRWWCRTRELTELLNLITNQQSGSNEVKVLVNQEAKENQSTKRTYKTREQTELANQQN